MRRRLFWLAALAGIVWFYLRRGARRPEPVRIPTAPDPAEDLRRKLEQTKERGDGAGASEPESQAEAPEPPAPADSEELDAKRREVHDRARSAADEMRRSSSD